jgi:hypothetical protein
MAPAAHTLAVDTQIVRLVRVSAMAITETGAW